MMPILHTLLKTWIGFQDHRVLVKVTEPKTGGKTSVPVLCSAKNTSWRSSLRKAVSDNRIKCPLPSSFCLGRDQYSLANVFSSTKILIFCSSITNLYQLVW